MSKVDYKKLLKRGDYQQRARDALIKIGKQSLPRYFIVYLFLHLPNNI